MTDAALFALGSLLAVLASVVASLVTLRVERLRRANDDRRRWDEQRAVIYAEYLAAADEERWRRLRIYETGEAPPRAERLYQTAHRAYVLMTDDTREAAHKLNRSLQSAKRQALSEGGVDLTSDEVTAMRDRSYRETDAAYYRVLHLMQVELGISSSLVPSGGS